MLERPSHTIIDIAPDSGHVPPISDALRRQIRRSVDRLTTNHANRNTASHMGLSDRIESEIDDLANRFDTERLGLGTYPHALLSGEHLALQVAAARDPHLPVDDLVSRYTSKWRDHVAFPKLGDLALEAVCADKAPLKAAETLRDAIVDAPEGFSDEKAAVVTDLSARLVRAARSAPTYSELGRVYTRVLADRFEAQGLIPGRDQIIDAVASELRSVRRAAMILSCQEMITNTAFALPTVLALRQSFVSFRTANLQQATRALANSQQAACRLDELAKCPIVPISRTGLGPERLCADEAESDCKQRFPLPNASGTLHGLIAFSTGIPGLISAFPIGLGLTLGVHKSAQLAARAIRTHAILCRLPAVSTAGPTYVSRLATRMLRPMRIRRGRTQAYDADKSV